jgi:hypothetical protein
LACCIFAWGLQYKLSLYEPPQALSHHVAQAKLFPSDEHSRTAGILRSVGMSPARRLILQVRIALFSVLFCLTLSLSVLQIRYIPDSSRHLHGAIPVSLFDRPPPFLS